MGSLSGHSRCFWMRLIFVALAVTLVGDLFLSIGFQYLLNGINFTDPGTIPTLSQDQLDIYLSEEALEDTPNHIQEETGDITFSDPEVTVSNSNSLNILLIGQDRQEGEYRARSDSILLCTFRLEEKQLIMTSFLRDLYVQIPGYRSNRINAAYMAGGMKLLNDTLEANFGLRADGCVEVDFSGFAEIIDTLGGVTLNLRQDEAETINKSTSGNLVAGEQLLNGKQALAYARIRKLDADGDFSRTARQRILLEAIALRFRSAGPGTMLSLLRKVLPLVTTDMSREEILELARKLLPVLPELTINGQHIPAEGTYSYKKIQGMSVLVADMDAARQLLMETAGNEAK